MLESLWARDSSDIHHCDMSCAEQSSWSSTLAGPAVCMCDAVRRAAGAETAQRCLGIGSYFLDRYDKFRWACSEMHECDMCAMKRPMNLFRGFLFSHGID